MYTPSLTINFSAAYTNAVMAFLTSGDAQEVYFDSPSVTFQHARLQAGSSPKDVDLYVGSTWQSNIGRVDADLNPDSDQFSVDVLRDAIFRAANDAAGAKELASMLVRNSEWYCENL